MARPRPGWLLLALLAGACGGPGVPPPPADGVIVGPEQTDPWQAAEGAAGTVYRMVDRGEQLRAVLPHHNLPLDAAGEAIPPGRIVDPLALQDLDWTREADGEGAAERWSAPFPPPTFPRYAGRWDQALDHQRMLAVTVAGQPLPYTVDVASEGWGWWEGRIWLTLPAGTRPPAGEVRLAHDTLGHDAWHADLAGGAGLPFLVRDISLPDPSVDRSQPQQTLYDPIDRREALFVPAPGQVEDTLVVPAAARLELACGLALRPTFDPGDGVAFSAWFVPAERGRARELFRLELDPRRPEDRGWHDVAVDLAELGGQRGTLLLRTDPRGDTWGDLAAFAHPRVVVAAGPGATPSSVLLVVVDTLRADALEGDPPLAAGLRAFADDALHFPETVAPSPWTTPSVIAMLSGLYPQAHQGHARQLMRDGSPSLAVELREQGYTTWSLQTNPALRDVGVHRGFDQMVYLHDALADEVTDRALRWFEAAPPGPFLAYVHYMDCHLPYRAHPEVTGWDGAPPPGVEPPAAVHRGSVPEWDPDEAGRSWVSRRYQDEVRFLDHHLARLLEAVDPRVLVVVATDHGEELWDHGGFEHGHTYHREVLDAVLVLRPPEAPADPPVDRLASLVDLRPTVLGLLDLPVTTPCQGHDLLAADFPRHRTVFSEAKLYGEPGYAVATRQWRMSREGAGPAVLYDRGADPEERRDVAATQAPTVMVLERAYEVEHRLRCDTTRATVDARCEVVPDQAELDAATRRAMELLGYVEP